MTAQKGYRFLEPAALARMKNLAMVARGVVEGFIAGLHASPYKGFSAEFAEHREYAPGDEPRHLDYRLLARTERLYVKQYEEETNMRVQILLDTSGSMDYKHTGGITKLEYASYLTAVLSYLMVRQQDSVGLTAFDTQIRLDMPARSSPRHFHEMMQQLEAIRPGGETRIAETLHRLANRFQRRGLIVLVSDLYDEPEEVIRALHHFRHRRHEVIVFQIFDKAELEFPFHDLVSFHDLETDERLQVDPAFVRTAYQQQIEQFVATYRRACSESAIDYVMTDSTVPYDSMLSKYLARRGRL